MIEQVTITARPKANATEDEIKEAIASAIDNIARSSHRTSINKGIAYTRIPRHRYNTLSGINWTKPQDMLMGDVVIAEDGTYMAKIALGWSYYELLLPERYMEAARRPRAQLERFVAATRIFDRYEKAKQLLDQLIASAEASPAELHTANMALVEAEREASLANDHYTPAKSIGPDTSYDPSIDYKVAIALKDQMTSGRIDAIIMPKQAEFAMKQYIDRLLHTYHYLDSASIHIDSVVAYFQWILPDMPDFFAQLRYNILNNIRPTQRVKMPNLGALEVCNKGMLSNCRLYNLDLTDEEGVNGSAFRLCVPITAADIDPNALGEIHSIEGNGTQISLNWLAIVNALRARIDELTLSPYRNDQHLLTHKDRSKKRTLALSYHPEALSKMRNNRTRPGETVKALNSHTIKSYGAPVLTVPDYTELVTYDDNRPLLHIRETVEVQEEDIRLQI